MNEQEDEKHRFSRAGSANRLLHRKAKQDYVEEWTALLMKEKKKPGETTEGSVVIFRLEKEWFALITTAVAEIAERRPVHVIPQKSSSIFLGTVNLGGQLKLCINMHAFLEVATLEQKEETEHTLAYKRMLAISKEDDHWIFPVDEVYGIHHFDLDQLENVPVTVSKSGANYLKGVMEWNTFNVGFIDEDPLFYSLRRNIL